MINKKYFVERDLISVDTGLIELTVVFVKGKLYVGYDTFFDGEIKFTRKLNNVEREKLKDIFGQDCRIHSDWCADVYGAYLSWMDFEFSDDESGFQWNGNEKTYDFCAKINLIVHLVREVSPKFGIKGSIYCYGDSPGDISIIEIDENSVAIEYDVLLSKGQQRK